MDNLNPTSADKKHYALLVGVDEYLSEGIKRFEKAPKREVEAMKKYLTSLNLAFEIKTLLFTHQDEGKPTRQNIIKHFKSHLIDHAAEGVILLFYFCGHGSTEKADEHWVKFQGSPVNETLICYDSRVNGVWDLSDKELKYLIHQAAEKQAEVVVIVDSCHSGSITRNGESISMNEENPASNEKRRLDTYLEGATEYHDIPRHVLLSACQNDQTAYVIKDDEGDHRAKFTKNLLSVLQGATTPLSYRDIIDKCRQLVNRKKPTQNPQLEPYGFFDTFRYFLNLDRQFENRYQYKVEYNAKEKHWQVNFGLSRGMPFGTQQMATFELFEDKQLSSSVGHCMVSVIQQDYSIIEFNAVTNDKVKKSSSYWAVPTYLPIEKLRVYVNRSQEKWEAKLVEVFTNKYDLRHLRTLVEWCYADSDPDQTEFLLDIIDKDWSYQLRYSDTQKVFFSFTKAEKEDEVSRFHALKEALTLIENWQRYIQIAQPIERSKFHKWTDYCFCFSIQYKKEGKKTKVEFKHDKWKELTEITLDYPGEFGYLDEKDYIIDYQLEWKNNECKESNECEVHLYLLDFESTYEICSFFSGSDPLNITQILIPDEDEKVLCMDKDNNQEVGIYKLFVGEKSFSSFILEQEGLDTMKKSYTRRTETDSTRGDSRSGIQTNWFTQTFKLKMLRCLGDISAEDLPIPNTHVSIKAHSTFKASVSLISTARSAHSHELDYYLQSIADQKGWTLLDLSLDGRKETLLELHDIENKAALSPEQPLGISIAAKLNAGEELLAVTIPAVYPVPEDGELYQSLGLVQHTQAGHFELNLEAIPENPADGRLEPGHSLKIGFFIRPK